MVKIPLEGQRRIISWSGFVRMKFSYRNLAEKILLRLPVAEESSIFSRP
jgi:hypothetical protein